MDNSTGQVRWIILFLCSIMSLGNYYCIELPQALQTYMIEGRLELSYSEYNLIFTIYSLPNVCMTIIGGILFDRVGIRLVLMFFLTLLLLSQLIIIFSFITSQFYLTLVGRFIQGMGGESIQVAYGIMIAKYFHNKELAFAFAFDSVMSQVGPALSSIVSPMLYNINKDFTYPFCFGFCLLMISWLCAFIMLRIDSSHTNNHQDDLETSSQKEQLNVTDLVTFAPSFWILNAICLCMYGSFYSFNNNANDFLNTVFKYETAQAGRFMLFVYLTAASLTPIIGLITDKIGLRAILLLLSEIILISAMIVFSSYDGDNTIVVMTMLLLCGLYFAMFGSIFFPCLSIVVEENKLGTALGVLNAFQAVNMGISPLIFGLIKDQTENTRHGYFYPFVFVICQITIGIVLTVFLNIYDMRKMKNILNRQNQTDYLATQRIILNRKTIEAHSMYIMTHKDSLYVMPAKKENTYHLLQKENYQIK